MRAAHAVLFAGAVGLLGCSKPAEPPKSEFSKEQLSAQFYYDLGASTVDVSAYPIAAQEGYKTFLERCALCHTTARPLNSPLVSRKDWERYVRRMHERAEASPYHGLTKAEAKAVVEFLTHDSKVRKLDGKAAFAAKAADLQVLFEKVKAERSRLQIEGDKDKAVEPAPYTGTKP